ncbi:MAG TPA: tRNA-guanine transglycosylase, partial [Acetobacteraceae bacterium]|nr:tRNA-guanine transglycosylase [Acetobacteraceae bacterium]
DPACACPACARHSRAYLHHLIRAGEMLGPMLLTWHNVQYYQDLMRGLRDAIGEARFEAHAAALEARWRAAAGDTPPDDPAAESLAEDREAVPL